jgi:hypothetical protein
MTFSCLILTVKFVSNGYRIAVGSEKVTNREINFGLSRDELCGQPTGSGRINRSVDALFDGDGDTDVIGGGYLEQTVLWWEQILVAV